MSLCGVEVYRLPLPPWFWRIFLFSLHNFDFTATHILVSIPSSSDLVTLLSNKGTWLSTPSTKRFYWKATIWILIKYQYTKIRVTSTPSFRQVLWGSCLCWKLITLQWHPAFSYWPSITFAIHLPWPPSACHRQGLSIGQYIFRKSHWIHYTRKEGMRVLHPKAGLRIGPCWCVEGCYPIKMITWACRWVLLDGEWHRIKLFELMAFFSRQCQRAVISWTFIRNDFGDHPASEQLLLLPYFVPCDDKDPNIPSIGHQTICTQYVQSVLHLPSTLYDTKRRCMFDKKLHKTF